MLRLRHAARLQLEFVRFARAERAWWVVAVGLFALIAMLAVSTTQVVVPHAMYTLF